MIPGGNTGFCPVSVGIAALNRRLNPGCIPAGYPPCCNPGGCRLPSRRPYCYAICTDTQACVGASGSSPVSHVARYCRRTGKKKEAARDACSLEGGGYLLSHFRSTIGVAGFNFSVRNGKRWSPRAITTLVFCLCPASCPAWHDRCVSGKTAVSDLEAYTRTVSSLSTRFSYIQPLLSGG